MEMGTALWSFVLVVGLLTITPGIDTALVLRTAALGRRRRAWGVVLGIQTGTLLWGALTSLGLTALLTASQLAYEALRWAGVAYLVWLGGRMVWDTLRRSGGQAEGADADQPVGDGMFPGWRQGLVTNLLNPKVGVFYVAVLPQFIPAGAPQFTTGVLLACVHILLGLVWSTALIALARTLRGQLQRPAARRVLDRITGTVIVGLGLRLAASE
ncbi:threonine transporter RhtB [Streptomyces spiroverticillatus]|uniref:Threonine transporter RhtB n=1 Tax=Streptomyces finlayi TaxID=67296 RepID=A0A918X4L3_9ACTN|nr:LysE family translocator [Streptomyces finlayi]GHA31580.1 threonine transporter RhtB [Streptomyces spiroverticillatus]GHD11022.1 threonine transporter RhtB [Streptomyces finlayi]